jgi:MoaA/NifB/PqqE/SkfB family radical SAM enzyme
VVQTTPEIHRNYDKKSLLAYALRRTKWAFGDRSPILGYLKVTKRCNFDCHYCPWHTAASDFAGELSTERWREIIDDLYARGVRIFVFEGGEPTLRRDLQELLDYTHERGALTIVATNGSGNMWRFRPRAFTVSVDGPEAMHDQVRGRGSFQRILRNLETKGSNRVVTITVISRENRNHLREMAETIAPLIDGFLFTFQYPYHTVQTSALTPAEVAETKDVILGMKRRFRILNPKAHLSSPTGAKACFDWLAISVNHTGLIEEGCFVQHVEPRDCSRCELGCFQVLSSFHQFNAEAWFNLNRLLLDAV